MRRLAAGEISWRVVGGVVACWAMMAAAPRLGHAQQASISAWEAAQFRSWSFIPNWTTQDQVNSFASARVYDHLSDVLYAFGVQPKADGSLYYHPTSNWQLPQLKSHQEQFGFRYHMCMFTVNGGSVETVWNAVTNNATTRNVFANNVKNLLAANNMTGFNLDWERPDTVTEWNNYSLLAQDLKAAFPAGWEVSVDDYGSTSSQWGQAADFDPSAYDQIGMMGYHYPANNGTSLDQQSFADGKKAIGFKDSQIMIGMGTWGAEGPATVSLKNIVAVDPNLPANATSWTGTVNDINGVSRTGTWNIVSRYEVRDNVQLALNRGMAGVMWWALNYDAQNKMSLARVAQHYAMVKRAVPDLTLDGKVNAADANALADNMGTSTTATGTTTQAQFESFYQNGNWEKGDRDGNGWINQADADWLAGRYAALGVTLPDRLAYTGTFEKFQHSVGLAGRWQAERNASNQLIETGNFTQQNPGAFTMQGGGPGGTKYSDSSVVIRNRTAAETTAGVNGLARTMRSTLTTPMDLGQANVTYFTFLVRQSTTPLTAAQLQSDNRTLSLEMLDAAGTSQFDFTVLGKQTDFSIRSQADVGGQDVQGDGFGANLTYMFIGKISGNGTDAHTLQASLMPSGLDVPNFTDPNFAWTLTAQGGAGFNPVITQLRFASSAEGYFTVSNVMIGSAADLFGIPMPGDFNADTNVDMADLTHWKDGFGMSDSATHWEGDADGDGDSDGFDFLMWQQHLGASGVPAAVGVPEPTAALLALTGLVWMARRR